MEKYLKAKMERLRKILALDFPPYHYKHSDVFAAYWNLYDILFGKKKGGDEE